MRSRTWVLAVSSCALFAGVGACTNNSDPTFAVGEIGPDGGTVTSTDSILTIAILPEALDETITLTIERSTDPPEVFGPAFRVSPNLELAIPATITYRYPLPDDTSDVAVGHVSTADFEAGDGRWVALPLGRLDTTQQLVTGLDDELSLFYGLLDNASSLPPSSTTTTDTTTTDPATTTDPDTSAGTTGGTDDGSTDNGSDPTTSDPDTSDGTTTTDGPGESTDEGETTDEGTTTGAVDACDNLPAPPLMVDEFMFNGTPLDGSSEDLTFTTGGEIMARNGDAFARIAPDGTVQPFNTMTALPATTLGLRWSPTGTLITASQTTNEILEIQNTGAVAQLVGGLNIPNGIFIANDGNVFFTEFNGARAAWTDAAGAMVTDLGLGGAEAPQANGIIYDPDRNYVYYVSYGPGILWRVDVTDLANPGAPQNMLTIASEGGGDQVGLDGIAMDECGNLYIVDQNQGDPGSLYRVQLDEMGDLVGGEELLVETFPDGAANVVFAQGAAWAAYETSVFVIGLPGRIFTVDVGVAGAPTPIGG
ncbi:MAG: hypothetical protein AAF799_15530 [Myxococcota bacterium]